MNTRRIPAVLALILMVTAASAQPGAGPVATEYVPASFFAAAVVDPVRLDKAAKQAGLPADRLWKTIKESFGVDPLKLDRVVLLIEPLPGGNVAFFPAAALRFPAGTDARKQLSPLLGETKEFKVGNRTYMRSTKKQLAKAEMAGYAVDDRTLLFAPWPTLEQMLKAPDEKDRPLAKALAAADLDHDLTVVIVPDPVMRKVESLKKASGKGTPQFDPFRPALKELETAVVTVDLNRDTLLRGEFTAATAEGTKTIHDLLKGLLATAKEAYPQVRKGLEEQIPAEFAKPAMTSLDAAVNDHKLATDGKAVILTVPRPKELGPKQ
jgi:hypothetical protein